jgi:hypothetical protein
MFHALEDDNITELSLAGADRNATLALRDSVLADRATPSSVKSLLKAKAHPHFSGAARDAVNAIAHAIAERRHYLLQAMHENWPRIECPFKGSRFACHSDSSVILEYAFSHHAPPDLVSFLLEIGVPYRRLEGEFIKRALDLDRPTRDGLDFIAEGQCWKLIYRRFNERTQACQLAAISLMNPRFRQALGLSRDVGFLLAGEVMKTSRSDVWESSEIAKIWRVYHGAYLRDVAKYARLME